MMNTSNKYEAMQDGKRLFDICDLCQYLGIGRTTAIFLAREMGWDIHIGRRVLYDRLLVDRWCDEQAEKISGGKAL